MGERSARRSLTALEAQLAVASAGGSSSRSGAEGAVGTSAALPPERVDTPTLRDWLEVRYLPHHALEHAPKTHVQETYLASWLATLLGDRKLHELTTNLVEQYKVHRFTTPTERLKRPVSPRTVNGELRVLSSSLRYAAELEILRTPLPRMRQVPGRSPPKRYLTPDEVERLLEGAKSGDPRTWLLALVPWASVRARR